jgi:predicted flavoprotein YhiN
METPVLTIDFKPDSSFESLVKRLGTARAGFLTEARLRWRLDEPTCALLSSLLPPEAFHSAMATACAAKQFRLTLRRPRSVDEAISTAGGVAFSCLNERLMLSNLPGVFVAGEMLDWEAPTGGYLMQGCFATGTRAGIGAAEWIGERQQSSAS